MRNGDWARWVQIGGVVLLSGVALLGCEEDTCTADDPSARCQHNTQVAASRGGAYSVGTGRGGSGGAKGTPAPDSERCREFAGHNQDAPPSLAFSPLVVLDVPASRLLVGDLNGDGNEDLIAKSDEQALLLPGDGAGAFGESVELPLVIAHSKALAVSDVDLDGVSDLIGSHYSLAASGEFSTRAFVYYGGEEPELVWSAEVPNVIPLDETVAAGDFNGDGSRDLGICGKGASCGLAFGAAGRRFDEFLVVGPQNTPQITTPIAFDIDADGMDELVFIAVYSAPPATALAVPQFSKLDVVDGTIMHGSWAVVTLGHILTRELVQRDLTGDGRPEVLSLLSNALTIAWPEVDNAYFHATYCLRTEEQPSAATNQGLALGYFDHDGELDVVVSHTFGTYGLSFIHKRAGIEGYTFPSVHDPKARVLSPQVIDLNRDGLSDLAVITTELTASPTTQNGKVGLLVNTSAKEPAND